MKNINPFVEIEKVPLFANDNMQSRGYSVRIECDASESGWKEVGLVSSDYLLVPNRQVRDMALEITDRSELSWEESKVFFDGKRFVYALVASPSISAEVQVGDILTLGLMFENSYDGSRKLAVSLFANRLVCSNGMLVPQYFTRKRFKHDSLSAGWEEEVHRALSMIQLAGAGLIRFAKVASYLTQYELGSEQLKHIRSNVLDRLPTGIWGKVMDQYLLSEDLTAWGLLNAGTFVSWHREKATIQDFNHNELISSKMIGFAQEIAEEAEYTIVG